MSSELLIKLDAVNDPSVPPWALLLIQSFKVLITEFKELNDATKRINQVEDINAICKNTCVFLTAENKRLNDDLIKLHESVDDQEQRYRNLSLNARCRRKCK